MNTLHLLLGVGGVSVANADLVVDFVGHLCNTFGTEVA